MKEGGERGKPLEDYRDFDVSAGVVSSEKMAKGGRPDPMPLRVHVLVRERKQGKKNGTPTDCQRVHVDD